MVPWMSSDDNSGNPTSEQGIAGRAMVLSQPVPRGWVLHGGQIFRHRSWLEFRGCQGVPLGSQMGFILSWGH